MAELYIRCLPEGPNVRCNATAYNVGGIASRDVTETTNWFATSVYGSFVQPGLFVPSAHGDITITARFEQFEPAYPPKFLVGPGQPARPLYYAQGTVKDAATGATISGATVRIESGHSAGRAGVSNERGIYRIDPVLTSELFTITASKEGYQPQTKSHRVEIVQGSGAAYVDFELGR
jgi:Carboxypeptidase regulatory-like domain